MAKQIFKDERTMQDWLSRELRSRESLSELLHNIDEFEDYRPTSLSDKRVFEAFKCCINSLNVVSIISEN